MSLCKSPAQFRKFKFELACDLIKHVQNDDVDGVRACAARGATLDYAFDHAPEEQLRVADMAATHGSIKTLMFLKEKGHDVTALGLRRAAAAGHAAVLTYADAAGVAFPADIFDYVALSGDLDMANVAWSQDCAPTPHTLAIALEHQHTCLVHFLVTCCRVPVDPSHVVMARDTSLAAFLKTEKKKTTPL